MATSEKLTIFTATFLSILSMVSPQHATPVSGAVLDSDGAPLRPNTKYYMLPAPGSTGGGGGGLALSIRDRRDPCPPNVMQESDPNSIGLSLELFPVRQPAAVIGISADVNIVFMAATTCVQRTVWQVGAADVATGRRYVRMNGVVGRPGKGTVDSWFKVEEHRRQGGVYYYKIAYCPTVCGGACGVECGNLGVVEESGRRWVGLGGEPFLFVFKKATTA